MTHTLNNYIRKRTPRFNRLVVEGYMHHRLRYAVEYIDEYLNYTCKGKTQTHLRYIGYEYITPEEELSLTAGKNSSQKPMVDVSRSDVYAIRVKFDYAGVKEFSCVVHLPWIERGNIWHLNGAKYLVAPVLADKVISVGRDGIFVNVTTAKYNFNTTQHHLYVDGVAKIVSVVTTELYKNQPKKLEPTTKAKPTNIHYLLCVWGYAETMERLLGFVPEVHVGKVEKQSDRVYYESFGIAPPGYLKTGGPYQPTHLSFSVPTEKANEEVQYIIGNLFYVIDNFSDRVLKTSLEKPVLWTNYMGTIIHSGNFPMNYLMEKMTAHFKDLQSTMDRMTQTKLKQVNVEATNLIELLAIILSNYNVWSVRPDTSSLYGRKTLETELFALSRVTSMFVRFVLDITKEELRNEGKPLEDSVVDVFVKNHLRRKPIYKLREDNTFVEGAGTPRDHLYPRGTAIVSDQKPNPTSVKKRGKGKSTPKKIDPLHSSMITVGCILGVPKADPGPMSRINPFVNLGTNGSVLPHSEQEKRDEVDQVQASLENVEYEEDDYSHDFMDDEDAFSSVEEMDYDQECDDDDDDDCDTDDDEPDSNQEEEE